MPVSFKTLSKHKVLMIKQPFIINEKDKNGKIKARRQIQYVEHLDSIYVDEQHKIEPKATPTRIRINNGIITVEDEDPRKIEVLRKYPDNVSNGGNLFKELDVANEELYEIQKYEKMDRARKNIMESEENSVRAAAVFFLNPKYLHKTFATIKIRLREAAEAISQKAEDPTNFIDNINAFFAEKNNSEKLTAVVAIHEGIIKIMNGKNIAWADSEEKIFIAAQQKDVIQDFAVWMKSDKEGRQILSVLADKIAALKKSK